jgi:diguanylate cyclase (GGDEF)-like protein
VKAPAHREEDHYHDPARSAAALFGAASFVTALGLLLPHVSQVDEGGLVFVSAAAGAVALALVLGRHRIPHAVYPLVALTGTVLVSLSLYFNGERHGGPAGGDEMYFLWIVLWAAVYLRRRVLAVEVVAILVAYGVTLHAIDPGVSAMSRWITLSGLVVGAAIVVRLLSERIEGLISEMRANASTDPLTGLANRRGLAAAYARELAQHQRTGRAFSLLVGDLDRFKQINDELGHKAGDRALVEIADLLRAQVRAVDTAARIGGDEFALLLSEADDVHAAQVAERLDAAVDEHATRERWPGTISIGVSVSTTDGVSLDDLLRHADSRLYLAKRRSVRTRAELDAAA